MIPSQMLKGTLEGCIMAVISRQPTYGYEITQKLADYGFARSPRVRSIPCCCGWRKTVWRARNTVPPRSAPGASTIC